MLTKKEIKYIQSFLYDQEEKLQNQLEEIERRESMDDKYKKLNVRLLGKNFLKTKSWGKRVELEFKKVIGINCKLFKMLGNL